MVLSKTDIVARQPITSYCSSRSSPRWNAAVRWARAAKQIPLKYQLVIDTDFDLPGIASA